MSDDEAAARRFLARHLEVLASAINVEDWPAYIRQVVDGHRAGTSWLDVNAVWELAREMRDKW